MRWHQLCLRENPEEVYIVSKDLASSVFYSGNYLRYHVEPNTDIHQSGA